MPDEKKIQGDLFRQTFVSTQKCRKWKLTSTSFWLVTISLNWRSFLFFVFLFTTKATGSILLSQLQFSHWQGDLVRICHKKEFCRICVHFMDWKKRVCTIWTHGLRFIDSVGMENHTCWVCHPMLDTSTYPYSSYLSWYI